MAFEYLKNYGVKTPKLEFSEIDVNDRLRLQDQINQARKNYSSLLSLFDSVQQLYLECGHELSNRFKEINKESTERVTNATLSADDIYSELEYKQQALKAGLSEINMQIDYYKNDLRLLNSVFYNKF